MPPYLNLANTSIFTCDKYKNTCSGLLPQMSKIQYKLFATLISL